MQFSCIILYAGRLFYFFKIRNGLWKKNAEEQIVNWRLKYLDEEKFRMRLHFRTIEKYLKWLLLGWKSSRNIWRKLGCYSNRSTSLPILSCHNLYLRGNILRKKGNIIFKTAQNFVRILLLTAHQCLVLKNGMFLHQSCKRTLN